MPPKDIRVRIPGHPTNKLRARTTRTRAGQARKVNGQDGKEGQQAGWTRKGKDMLRAGQTRTVHGQDGHGTKWAGRQKSWTPTRPDQVLGWTPRQQMAQHSLKQSYPDTLDYKWHSLGRQNIYLQIWTINGYGHSTVQG